MSKSRIYLILSYLESSFTSVCFSLYFWIWASWVWMTFLAMSSTTWSASTAASLNDCSASDIAPFLTKEKMLKNFGKFYRIFKDSRKILTHVGTKKATFRASCWPNSGSKSIISMQKNQKITLSRWFWLLWFSFLGHYLATEEQTKIYSRSTFLKSRIFNLLCDWATSTFALSCHCLSFASTAALCACKG